MVHEVYTGYLIRSGESYKQVRGEDYRGQDITQQNARSMKEAASEAGFNRNPFCRESFFWGCGWQRVCGNVGRWVFWNGGCVGVSQRAFSSGGLPRRLLIYATL